MDAGMKNQDEDSEHDKEVSVRGKARKHEMDELVFLK
jgi:hypothetical protein